MLQRQNLAPQIFQDIPIKFKNNSTSFICNENKKLLGIQNVVRRKDWANCEIVIFEFKENKWFKYFKINIQEKTLLYLLCFTNNDTQLLFYRYWTNSIEFISVNQKSILGIFNYLSGTIKCFFQFSSKICFQTQMRVFDNQKMILIQTDQQYLLFDITQLQILQKFDRDGGMNFYKIQLNFLDRIYLIIRPYADQGYLKFQNIKNGKVKKILKQRSCQDSQIYQLFNCKNLAISWQSRASEYEKRVFVFATILNMINLKYVRKMIVQGEDQNEQKEFVGFTYRYLLYKAFSYPNTNLAIIDYTIVILKLPIQNKINIYFRMVFQELQNLLMLNYGQLNEYIQFIQRSNFIITKIINKNQSIFISYATFEWYNFNNYF